MLIVLQSFSYTRAIEGEGPQRFSNNDSCIYLSIYLITESCTQYGTKQTALVPTPAPDVES